MNFVNSDFTAELYNSYVVDTSEGDVTCTMPDTSTCGDDCQIIFVNYGVNSINYIGFNENQKLNGQSTFQNSIEKKSDLWWTGSGNWYRFG